MSELQSLKKAELSEICHRLGIHSLTKDTKKVLVERVTEFIASNPDDGIAAVQAALDAEIGDTETLTEEVEAAVAAAAATTDDEEEEEDDDEEDDEEEDEEEVDAEDADDEDKDYNAPPPVDLKGWVVDPAIEYFETAYSKVLDFTDKVGITTLDLNGELRENLSRSVTLNYFELALEFSFFLYTFVPFVAIKDNDSIHQFFKDNISFVGSSDIAIPDFTALIGYAPISTFISWVFISVVFPLIVSYYVNFTRRLITFDDETELFGRIYQYDPFTFALSKTLLFYFLGVPVHHDFIREGGLISALKNHFIIQLDFYQKFAQILGGFPLIIGFSNVLVAIYSQFEEY
ncbi:hypothetical protein CAAN1_01S12508 [[Candida] anglica]|uniref:SAP domain-containing protein n=1 Tax=[Candida] anglica TaxID=148631 RepID=A0ABP0EKI1_9ASCO